jgi:hypothetical protein
MSAQLMPSLARTIEFVRTTARADVARWASAARDLKTLPLVGVDSGVCAMALAASARTMITQLPDLRPGGEAAARTLLLALADVLQAEFDARFVPPYYVDKDGEDA